MAFVGVNLLPCPVLDDREIAMNLPVKSSTHALGAKLLEVR